MLGPHQFACASDRPFCSKQGKMPTVCVQSSHVKSRGIVPRAALAQWSVHNTLGLITIPEAFDFTEKIRSKKLENKSSEFFPKENGLTAWTDLG